MPRHRGGGLDRREFAKAALAIGGTNVLSASLDRGPDLQVPPGVADPDDLPPGQHEWNEFLDRDDWGNVVSPRTPYNRVPLPEMELHLALERDGETVEQLPLEPTIDHAAGFHYGGAVSELRDGDLATIDIRAPPQTARHQGYETAFIDMTAVAVELSR